ncbi:MAG: veratrol--corrinoid protein metyltransferase [Peptococcaceae bacterium]|jgi:hypothetical protein|nr:veratrol--corrinoid protein metyltransferase [Peptococcaceae bacterium]
MAKMTEKENLMRIINGQEPAWVPRKGIVPFADVDPEQHTPCCVNARAEVFPPKKGPNGGRISVFGVEYEPTDSTGGLELPVPNRFILDDITKWRDVIKTPSLEGIDWDAIAKKSIEHIDRNETAVEFASQASYFQQLMNFMGFTEGLCAMQEEPEEVLALYEYLTEYYETIIVNLIDRIKPDLYGMSDDNATARSPFISREMNQKLIVPFQARIAKHAQERGIPIEMHDCGRCEDFIEDWRGFGVKLWNPAQVMNDLAGIKKRYGNDFVLVGCWDSSGPAGWPGADEEVVRQGVRDCIDAFAPGGGFCFWASFYGAKGDERARQHAFWIADEYNKYGRTFYQRQG